MRKHTLIVGILSIIILLLAGVGFWAYCLILAPDFEPRKTVYVYIDEKKDFEDLCRQLADSAGCRRIGSFRQLAGMLKYPLSMRTGRYAVEPGMNNLTMLNNLRRGHQEATRITFNYIRIKQDLADRLARQLMIGENDLLSLLTDSAYCASLGFTTETVLILFIPNTYEVYWNISAEKLMQRMQREYKNFWNDARLAKAKEIGMTPVEVAILASIVEEETAATDEYPVVAGVDLSRLPPSPAARGVSCPAFPSFRRTVRSAGSSSQRRGGLRHPRLPSCVEHCKVIKKYRKLSVLGPEVCVRVTAGAIFSHYFSIFV